MSDPRALEDVTAVVLAGGSGTRLRPALSHRPKVLAPVRGRPFLAHLLAQLASWGVRRAVLCTGHRADMVEDAFGPACGTVELVYSVEDSPLGTGGALRRALSHLDSPTVLALNGDSICEADLAAFRRWHDERASASTLLLVHRSDTARSGRVEIGDDGRIEAFHEKDGANVPGWINAGVYLLARERVAEIAPLRAVSIERDVFPAWIGRGLLGYRTEARFLDIGTPDSYRRAEAFLDALRQENGPSCGAARWDSA